MSHGIISAMNKDSVLLLLVGFLLGFLMIYLWVRDRDLGPIIIRDSAALRRQPVETEATAQMREQLENQLASDPTNFQVLVQMGNLHFDSENFTGAAEYYRQALEVSPDNVNISTDLGTALYYSNRIAEAVVAFERSLSIAPNHPQSLFNMGVVLLEERNDTEGAIRLWQRLVDANPEYPQVEMVKDEIARLRQEP